MEDIKQENLEVEVQPKKEIEAGLNFFKKKAKETTELGKFYLDDEDKENEEKIVKYYKLFARDKRDEVIEELLTTMNEAHEAGIDFFKTFKEEDLYLNFLIIKHFVPKFKKMLEGKDFATHLEVMNVLYQADYIAIFIQEMFDLTEVDKVYQQHSTARERMSRISKMMDANLNAINKQLQNQGIKNVAEQAMKGKKKK